jgi:hypothetical protein
MQVLKLSRGLIKVIKTAIEVLLDTREVDRDVFMGIIDVVHKPSQKFG